MLAAGLVVLAPAIAAVDLAITTMPAEWIFPLSEAPPDYWLTGASGRSGSAALAATAVLVGAALVAAGCLGRPPASSARLPE